MYFGMIVNFIFVVSLILMFAYVLKRVAVKRGGVDQLNVEQSLSLGGKEKLIIIKAGENRFLLGVTPQQITMLTVLDSDTKDYIGELHAAGNP